MISLLTGTVAHKYLSTLILDVNGVGYEIACTYQCAEKHAVGDTATIITYTDVKEDSIRLFGFHERLEKQIFLMLTAVKGVGSKSSLEILSTIPATALLRIIGSGDLDQLRRVKGIGKKTAERIVVELKDKVSEYAGEMAAERPAQIANGESYSGHSGSDAIAALQALGFSEADSSKAVGQALTDPNIASQSVGEIVKEALRYV